MDAPTPYSGNEKYIFISYSHKDSFRVIPVIRRLMAEGYRVWYDMGIDPGTEWDENIAEHIKACGYFIALMSENYLASSNCKDELNYARDLEKDRLIIYLEGVELPSGMAMRINRIQSIFKYTYTNEEAFYQKLFTTNNINVCNKYGTVRSTSVPPKSGAVGSKPAAEPVHNASVNDVPPAKPAGSFVSNPQPVPQKPANVGQSNQGSPETQKGSVLGGIVCGIIGVLLFLVANICFTDANFWNSFMLLGASFMFWCAYSDFKNNKAMKVIFGIILAFSFFYTIITFIIWITG